MIMKKIGKKTAADPSSIDKEQTEWCGVQREGRHGRGRMRTYLGQGYKRGETISIKEKW